MAAGRTYTPIANTILTSASTSITFSSISSSYTDLVLVISGNYTAGNPDAQLRFNNDTATNYSQTVLEGTGSAAGSARATNNTLIYLDWVGANTDTMNYVYSIMNYSNTTTYKSILGRFNKAGIAMDAIVGLWRSTSAINRIDISVSSGLFNSGTTFTLYGIAAA